MMQIEKIKIELKDTILWNFVFNGAFQRGKIYSNNDDNNLKNEFKETIKEKLNEYLGKYKNGVVSDDLHFENIWKFKEEITQTFKDSDLLSDNKLRFGTAQKIFNLYLKIMWVYGKIEPPPHCPFDRIIVVNILKIQGFNWTEYDEGKEKSQKKYKELVDKVNSVKNNNETIADWELIAYSEYLKK
jgi:preprotein translocase subunit SecA